MDSMKIVKTILSIYCTLIGSAVLLHADDQKEPPADKKELTASTESPWLTGSLIAPVGAVVPKGHFEIEPYLYFTTDTALYDKHWHAHSTPNFYSISPQIYTLVGITEWMDIQVVPQMITNICQNQSSTYFADLPIGFDFQLFGTDASKWFPGIKLTLTEIFPTGKYQKMSPSKKRTDQSGQGSFATLIDVVFYKVYHIVRDHFLSTTLSFSNTFYAPVHVKGFNVYGGGYGTSGKAFPGRSFLGIFSFEYTLTQNWVFALDNVYTHVNRTRFSGKKGHTKSGTEASVGGPSSEQLSFAPAIEYNFNSNIGLIAGVWFTALGRNSTEFQSGIIALDFSY